MFKELLRTNDSWAPLLLRIVLGSAALMQGATALIGAGMGEGPTPLSEKLSTELGVPPLLALPAGIVLLLGGVLLVCGWCTRLVAALISLVMVAMLFDAWPSLGGEWLPVAPERFRVLAHALSVTVGLALMITGGGRLSADRRVQQPR